MGFPFKLVTYNVHHGLSTFRRHGVLDDIIGVLEATQADIVCLQEVLRETTITPGALERACKKVWQNGVYGKTFAFAESAQGNCVISRLPITYHENINVSCGTRQPRAVLRSDILLEGSEKPLIVLCTHLCLTRRQRSIQCHEIIDYIASLKFENMPIILAGDFNDWQRELSQPIAELSDFKEAFFTVHQEHARTYPSFWPLLALDRIYYHGLQLSKVRVVAEAGWKGRPDHLPLLAEFDLLPSSPPRRSEAVFPLRD